MADDRQLKLLEAIACAVGVTPGAVIVRRPTVGQRYMARRTSVPRGRGWQLERNLLRAFVVRFWRRPASLLGPADWQDFHASRRKQKTRTGRPPCDLTVNLELKAVKRMLLPDRPFDECKPVKTRTRRESWFTADQIDRLITAADSLRWLYQQVAFRAAVAVMADTGLRISEALSLRWDRITLRGTTVVRGKGGKDRAIGFTRRALLAMGTIPRHANPHVFVNWNTGKTFDPSTVRAWFRRAIEIAGLEGVKADGDLALVPHCLRHSFASIADERGAPASWIQSAMGHSLASTTAVYLHRSEADAAVRMAAIMGDRLPARRAVPENVKREQKKFATNTTRRVQA